MKKILLLFMFLISSVTGWTATFVVTSNADSGLGTLRQALLDAAANGSAVTDYINFNLPDLSEAGRTINLTIQLPGLSSNLVIDGTTQPGNKFGVSDAKVKITNTYSYPKNINTFYSSDADMVEIYGLWIFNIADMSGYIGSAIHIRKFGTVKIGAPGKGNLIERGNIAIDTGKTCYIQNNVCWVDLTGEIARGGAIDINTCDNVTIGGSATMGNVMAGILNVYFANPVANTLAISYNILGTNYTGTKAPYGFDLTDESRVTISGPYLNSGQPAYAPVDATIKNNIIADVYGADLLQYGPLGGNANIQGNAFNTDFTGTLNFNQFSHGIAFFAITVNGNGNILIGGDDPLDKNLIAYCEDGVGYAPGGKYTISRNSIFCVGEVSFVGFVGQEKLPAVSIKSVLNGAVTGTATPLSDVELFNADCSCTIPTPKNYFTTVKTDANGNWAYTGAFDGYLMASATINNLTGYFTGLSIDDSKVNIINYYCSGSKGSVTGITTQAGTNAKWYNAAGALVGTDVDLKDVEPGVYTLKIGLTGPCTVLKTYTIKDLSVKIDLSKIKLVKPTCTASGTITGVNVTSLSNQVVSQWVSQTGQIMCNCSNLSPVPPGIYSLIVTNGNSACPPQTFGPFDMNISGSASVNATTAIITPTNCGQSTGSITNITATGTGTLKYSWKNAALTQVSTTKDLLNQPAGKYTLQVTDDTNCGPVYTSAIEIPELNGVSMDESAAAQTPIACGSSTGGTVTGIKTTGAITYQWFDANNNLVASTADLTNAAPGSYHLIAANNTCSKTSKVYTIALSANTDNYGTVTNTPTDATCGLNNGGISLAFTGNQGMVPASYRWVNNATGITVATTSVPSISNIDAGNYDVYAANANGCERLLSTYNVLRIPPLSVDGSNVQLINDNCGTGTGSIKAIGAAGKAPLSFIWTDDGNNTIATTADLLNVKAGTYHIKVTDGAGCSQSLTYTISNQSSIIAPPTVPDLQLCSAGSAMLSVTAAQPAYAYRLYDSNASSAPLADEKTGRFTINVKTNRSYFISQYIGDCESVRAEVKVSVGITAIGIANAFTPNGDGINDTWNIANVENYPNAVVQIFTRDGQKIFESIGYKTRFDGTFNGKALPVGTYFYIINLNAGCSTLSGGLTIIR